MYHWYCSTCFAELLSALAYLQQPLHGLAALPEEPLKSRLSDLLTTALDVLSVSVDTSCRDRKRRS